MIDLDLDLLPFHVRLEQLGTRAPVMVRWAFPVEHAGAGLSLVVSTLVDITSWS